MHVLFNYDLSPQLLLFLFCFDRQWNEIIMKTCPGPPLSNQKVIYIICALEYKVKVSQIALSNSTSKTSNSIHTFGFDERGKSETNHHQTV